MAISTSTTIRYMPIVQNRQAVTAKWIFGRDAFSAQVYLVHTEYPAFLAKIARLADGIFAPPSYAIWDNRRFCEFVWLDPYPGEIPFINLMREAEDAFKRHLFQ